MSSNLGVANFYYTQSLPPTGVAIAYVTTPLNTPADVTNIDNQVFLPATLGIWKSTSDSSGTPDFLAPDYNISTMISGDPSYSYVIQNQYFEITTYFAVSASLLSRPLYYKHQLPAGATSATILDLSGNVVTTQPFEVVNGVLYHDCDGSAYRVRCVDASGYLDISLLKYNLVLIPNLIAASETQFLYAGGRSFTLPPTTNASIRFLKQAGYQVFPPYGAMPNAPWYLRIGYSVQAFPADWAKMPFQPSRPYLLGTWVPGKVLDKTLVEFERPNIYPNAYYLPDILIFKADNSIKYALEGGFNTPTSGANTQTKGSLYNWSRGMFSASTTDFYKSRVDLSVTLDPTDIVFGFYAYNETDYLLTDLDVNPFTNPAVKNQVIRIYYKNDPAIPTKNIFYSVYPPGVEPGSTAPTLTNDTNPSVTGTLFGIVSSGTSVGVGDFVVEDVRVRGGGLAPSYQNIPQAVNFWDLGYWDGKPWPIGGTLVVYLPVSLLNTMAAADIETVVMSNLPMGALPSIRYYDQNGNESI